ncbi:hypothetical protein B5X24_HaOG200723 [Helicoverpa armigera]|uniref:Gustatory receptor n=1 Tax=Helicoverpa armigera TaxID=29058 RepID=A0A2W1BZ57_HELAM|nr:hypothetical protein B5X24_HaOG200723 [Helicoverpa armigera]
MVKIDSKPSFEKSELSSNNVIEKDVQALLKPFNVIFALFISSKYRIQNDVIYQNTLLYKILSGISYTFLIAGYFYSIFRTAFIYKWEGINFTKQWCNVFIYAIYFLCCVINYHTNIVCSKINVVLVFKIQNISEILKVKGISLNDFIKFNWVYFTILNVYHVFWIVFFTIAFSDTYEYYEFLTNYVYILFDMSVLHGTRFLKVLRQPLKLWIREMRNSDSVLDEDNEYFWNNMFRIYEEILDTYQILTKTIQPVVSY